MVKLFARDMDALVAVCKHEIPKAFESEDYTRRVDEEMKEIQQRRQQISDQMEAEARQAGFALTQSQVGVTPVPMRDGRPMTPDEIKEMAEEDLKTLRARADEVQHMIRRRMADFRRLTTEASDKVQAVDKEIVLFTLTPLIDELQDRYSDESHVVAYLHSVQEDMVANLEIFKPKEEQAPSMPFGLPHGAGEEDIFVRYRVNDLVDNTECSGAPVVYEYSPTYYNLFGRIDYRPRAGTFTTDLSMIESGGRYTEQTAATWWCRRATCWRVRWIGKRSSARYEAARCASRTWASR
jgi:predicted ATP-dependent protease